MKEIKNSAYVTYNMDKVEYLDRKQIEKIFDNNFKKFLLKHKLYAGKSYSELRELYIESIKNDIIAFCIFAEYDYKEMDIRGFVESNI